jgi:hypothetical protein
MLAIRIFHRWHSQLLRTDTPKFGEPIQNQTIAVGREAVFSCVVDNLQTYKVSFFLSDCFVLTFFGEILLCRGENC